MKQAWRNIRPYILPPFVFLFARLLGATLRIVTEGETPHPSGSSRILAGWHGKTFVAAIHYRGRGVWTLISHSKDGDMQDKIFRRFGFRTIRGSTGRGGARALAQCIKLLRQGVELAFTPDGPRGPACIVQPGIVAMAQKSGAPIVPVGVSASKSWHVPTWDMYMVPKPFSRCAMVFGEPVTVGENATDDEFEVARKTLEERIRLCESQAEKLALA